MKIKLKVAQVNHVETLINEGKDEKLLKSTRVTLVPVEAEKPLLADGKPIQLDYEGTPQHTVGHIMLVSIIPDGPVTRES